MKCLSIKQETKRTGNSTETNRYANDMLDYKPLDQQSTWNIIYFENEKQKKWLNPLQSPYQNSNQPSDL